MKIISNQIPSDSLIMGPTLLLIKNGSRSYFNIKYNVQKLHCNEAIWLAEEAYNSFFRENDKKRTHQLYFDVLKEIYSIQCRVCGNFNVSSEYQSLDQRSSLITSLLIALSIALTAMVTIFLP